MEQLNIQRIMYDSIIRIEKKLDAHIAHSSSTGITGKDWVKIITVICGIITTATAVVLKANGVV